MKAVQWSVIFVAMLLMVNCSSLPDIRDERPQAAIDGQILLKRARQLSLQNKPEPALLEAERAYEKFTLSDDLNGKVLAGLDIARFSRKLGKQEESKAWEEKSHRLITVFVPSLLPDWQLLKAEFFFAEARYDSVLYYTETGRVTEEQDETVAHLLAYRLMAGLQLPSYDPAARNRDTKALEKIVSRLDERFEDYKLFDPYVLSFAEYALGYVAIKQQSWQTAAHWFEKALAIDKQFGNFRATADNLYAIGVTNSHLRQHERAQGYFDRAAGIYQAIGDTLSAQRTAVKTITIKLERNGRQDSVIKELQQLLLKVQDEHLRREIAKLINMQESGSGDE